MSTCFCATLRLSEGALRSLIYSCVISELHRKRKGVCVCVWVGWDQLRCSQTAVPLPLALHPHYTNHPSKRNRLMCCFWKMCAGCPFCLVLGGQRRSYLEDQTSLFLENKSFLLLVLTHMEDVLMATLLVELFCCCSPLCFQYAADSFLDFSTLSWSSPAATLSNQPVSV